jgi:hypothetical protein
MKFLLHKDKEEKGMPTAQKQECGCPYRQPTLRSHTHAFFTAHGKPDYILVKANTIKGAKTIN